MTSAASSRSISSSGGSCCSPCCRWACARRRRRATSMLGTTRSAPARPHAACGRRSRPRSSPRCWSACFWLAVDVYGLERGDDRRARLDLPAIKKARPFGLAHRVPRLNPSCRPTAQQAAWTLLSGLCGSSRTARPKGSSSQDLDRDAFLCGAGGLSSHSRPLVIEKTLPKLDALVTNLCAVGPKFLHESPVPRQMVSAPRLDRRRRSVVRDARRGRKGLCFHDHAD